MPTQTFFRLPDEKRLRLIEAARAEFSSVRFSDASINRIIHAAGIPRGSFYQYFEDKDDLFFYLLGFLRDEAFALMSAALKESGGDPLRATMYLFDAVFRSSGEIRPSIVPVLDILRQNQNMDMAQMILDRMREDACMRKIEEQICWTGFRETSPAFVQEAASLAVFSFACAVRNILIDGASIAEERDKLSFRLDIIRRGSMKEADS